MQMPAYSSFIQTPAKVNLGLKIVRRRADGYHDIHTVMEPVSLSDSIYCEFLAADHNSFHVQCPQLKNLESDNNLVVKAARLIAGIAQERGCEKVGSWEFFLDKRVPSGAGLGGGSSNAAAVIKLLDKFYQLNLNVAEMVQAATSIGADVPFFLSPQLALLEGIGDRITPLGPPGPRYYLLIKPPFSINTGWAYSALQVTDNERWVNYDIEQFKALSRAGSYILENDFEVPVMAHYPLLAEIKQWLLDSGCALAALMSGSGSVIYAIYSELEVAMRAEITARRQFAGAGCDFYLARNLAKFS